MNSIGAVLTDIQLPPMDGVNLIRAIKKIKPHVIAVASTGQGEEEREPRLLGLGVFHFLPNRTTRRNCSAHCVAPSRRRLPDSVGNFVLSMFD
jgi:CheY-like chemotaxis protein